MLARLTPFIIRHRRRVLVLAVLFLAVAGAFGGAVNKELSAGGFADPKAPSERAAALMESEFGGGAPNLALLVTSPAGVDSAAATAAGIALTARLSREPGVVQARSYWTLGKAAPLRSKDGTKALVLARLTGSEDQQIKGVTALRPRFAGRSGVLTVQVGGQLELFREVDVTIEHDLARAESIAFPVTAVLLVLVFGSAVAASLPLLIGVLSILGSFLTLHVLHGFTDVSVYAANLAISLGLGLGIDYSLFMLTRYREEVTRGLSPHDAVVEAVRTAGRTVLFSALTVLLSLSALLVFPLFFLKSFAYAGISAVFFAALGALVVLPAAIAGLGHRVDSLDLRKPIRRLLHLPAPRTKVVGEGAWHRLAVSVMKRPVGFGLAVVVLLLGMGLPFKDVSFSLPDDRVLPRTAQGHLLAEVIRTQFPGNESLALTTVATGTGDPTSRAADISSYALALSRLSGVQRVDALTGSYSGGRKVLPAGPQNRAFATKNATYLTIVPSDQGFGPIGERLASAVRATPAPFRDVVVGGPAASLADTKHSLGASMPLALGLIAIATFLVLFLFTGSVVIPVKAVALNLLSLSATFGAMVWVFQQGHLTQYIGDPITTGSLDTSIPIIMFCVLFGLSMDYEVFLLSRIKEEYDATGDNTRAVAIGLEKTGRLISAAAALLALVFVAFASSDISFIKLLGLGVALAVLVDATLVRGILVPAFMRLAGRANWWAPAPLRRLHDRIGLTEAPGPSRAAQEMVDA